MEYALPAICLAVGVAALVFREPFARQDLRLWVFSDTIARLPWAGEPDLQESRFRVLVFGMGFIFMAILGGLFQCASSLSRST